MIKYLAVFSMMVGLAIAAPAALKAQETSQMAEDLLYLDLEYGRVTIQLRADLAPQHVARIKELVSGGFYDGLTFHRVIDGFMVQGGDPKGNGTGGSGQKLPAEFSAEKHVRGIVSMARSANPDSADSQFFIVLDTAAHLDGQYTVWGQVIDGMEFVDQIKKGDSWANGRVADPDKIVKMSLGS